MTREDVAVSTTKIGPKHQVTIPKNVFEALHLEVGDILDAQTEGGNVVLVPKKLVEKAPAPKLTAREQKVLARARQKIERIRQDLAAARGLTAEEADLAARVGLIAEDQQWWWTEAWQKGEREAEKDIRHGRTKAFGSAEALINDLRGK
jgi:AbrB family looped-hinge helix DNA binding protein